MAEPSRADISAWLNMAPADCRRAVMGATMRAWKDGHLLSRGSPVTSRGQAVGIGMSKTRVVCDGPRTLPPGAGGAFVRDRSHNPLTGRAIDPDGFTAHVLEALARRTSPVARSVAAKTAKTAKTKAKPGKKTAAAPLPARSAKGKK